MIWAWLHLGFSGRLNRSSFSDLVELHRMKLAPKGALPAAADTALDLAAFAVQNPWRGNGCSTVSIFNDILRIYGQGLMLNKPACQGASVVHSWSLCTRSLIHVAIVSILGIWYPHSLPNGGKEMHHLAPFSIRHTFQDMSFPICQVPSVASRVQPMRPGALSGIRRLVNGIVISAGGNRLKSCTV